MPPPPPAPTLGPIWDGVLPGLGWITLMGLVGVLAFLALSGPIARDAGEIAHRAVTARLARVAVVLGVLALPVNFIGLAHDLSDSDGYDVGAAWHSLYSDGFPGVLVGLEYTLALVAVLLTLVAALRPGSTAGRRLALLALPLAAIGLYTTKFPAEKPDAGEWGRTSFETLMWVLHFTGASVWVGGLIGLFALALPGGLPAERRGRFWSRAIRRFSAAAMACVGSILLSGLWLYWEHVDGPSQLFTTLYGRVLGVKIILFGTMAILGAANQFWLHPRIDRLRAAGDDRPLLTLLAREFPTVIAIEAVLGMCVLMVAPFLHGSARNEAYQREHPVVVDGSYKKISSKEVSGSTWAYGVGETVVVAGIMAGGYVWAGRMARRRRTAAA
jgi:putative copper export protein